MFDHVQDLSLDYFTATSTGKVIARFTNDLSALQTVIARTPIYFIRDGLTAICNIGLIFYLNWRFALLTIGGHAGLGCHYRGSGQNTARGWAVKGRNRWVTFIR